MKTTMIAAGSVGAILLLVATGGDAACFSTRGIQTSEDRVATGKPSASRINLSLDQLIRAKQPLQRQSIGNPEIGALRVDYGSSMWVIAEGDTTNLSRFSIEFATPANETAREADAVAAIGVVASALGVQSKDELRETGLWLSDVLADLDRKFQRSTQNLVWTVHQKGRYRVTAIDTRKPLGVSLCFEPGDN